LRSAEPLDLSDISSYLPQQLSLLDQKRVEDFSGNAERTVVLFAGGVCGSFLAVAHGRQSRRRPGLNTP
jgi:hypothetical protein